MQMSESEFSKAAGIALASIERSIDELELDCECTFKGDGILQIEFDDGAKFILNRHLAAREIWLAAPKGGIHFKFDNGRWIGTRDQRTLGEWLGELLSEHARAVIRLKID